MLDDQASFEEKNSELAPADGYSQQVSSPIYKIDSTNARQNIHRHKSSNGRRETINRLLKNTIGTPSEDIS